MRDDEAQFHVGHVGREKAPARPRLGNPWQVHALQFLLRWIARLVIRAAVEL
jgi:hypothetical protein